MLILQLAREKRSPAEVVGSIEQVWIVEKWASFRSAEVSSSPPSINKLRDVHEALEYVGQSTERRALLERVPGKPSFTT